MWWIVTFFDTLTDTPVETKVPVKANNILEAKERAARFVPYLEPHTVNYALSDYTTDAMIDILDAGYDALCEFSDGNNDVSDFEFQTAVDFYNNTWDALDDELED